MAHPPDAFCMQLLYDVKPLSGQLYIQDDHG